MIPHILLRRMLFAVVMLPVLVAGVAISRASAATTLYVVANEAAEIWQIDPTTGAQLASFPLNPKNAATRPGLAFDGTEIFYTDETLAYVQVYSPTGTPVRTLPKRWQRARLGLGVSTTTLFLVSLDHPGRQGDRRRRATSSSPAPSTVSPSRIPQLALRDRERQHDDQRARRRAPCSLHHRARRLPRSRLLVVREGALRTRAGFLYAVDPDTGAELAGYPVDIKNMNLQRPTGRARSFRRAGARVLR
jgi:hypothetical protein